MTDIFKDAVSNSLFFELVDSTTGLPKTGIVYTDVTGSYVRTRSARVSITMSTLASASADYSAGGFILIDDTNQPGIYRLDVPDGAFVSGVFEVVVTIKATGCRTVSRQINLVNINNQVAFAPNVAYGGVGGLLTAPTTANIGTVDLLRVVGDAQSATDLKDFVDAGYDPSTNKVQGVTTVDTIASAGMLTLADEILKRNVSNVEATADEHTLATAILSLLEWTISGGDLVIKRTDGTTTHYVKTLSSATSSGNVITGLN